MQLTTPAPHAPHYAVAPVWLEFSGLPEALHGVRKNAWVVFRKLVELDCFAHPEEPGVVAVSATDVGTRTGFDGPAVLKMADGFRRRRLLHVFLPEHPDEEMLYQLARPLPVPATPEELTARLEAAFGPTGARAPRRYFAAPTEARDASQEALLRRVTDLYMRHVSLSINAFVLDELAMIARRFDPELVEAAMRAAASADERHLSAVYRRLRERRAAAGDAAPPAPTNTPGESFPR